MSRTYELTCTDCSFTTVVSGDTGDVYDAIESHQDEAEDSYVDHFVNFEARTA